MNRALHLKSGTPASLYTSYRRCRNRPAGPKTFPLVELALCGYEGVSRLTAVDPTQLLKIGLIIDNRTITRWQADGLRTLERDSEFLVYNCTNSRPSRRSPRHAVYYLLNLLALRTRLTARTALPPDIRIASETDFESEHDGIWQRLPAALLDRIRQDQPDVILKFGMGLLRVPANTALAVPILSYHHGDPREFRGRPAGFYELALGRETVGQVIQILSDRLDSGEIVAFGETRAHPHSYRSTMTDAYRCSPALLRTAIRNLLGGKRLEIGPTGKAYRLPGNAAVLGFAFRRLADALRRLVYGAFVEKQWQVAEAEVGDRRVFEASSFPKPDRWRIVERPKRYRFLADPFYHPGGEGVLVEALRSSTGVGEILHVGPTGAATLSDGKGHYSYPATFTQDGEHYVLPEMSEWSASRLFRLGSRLEELGALDVPGSPRLLDPTLHSEAGKIFLFGNIAAEGGSVLRLWVGDSLSAPFREHPASPILVSPAGARMAGGIVSSAGARLRLGQDGRRDYGDGIVLFRIERLSADEYEETRIGELRFESVRGPHTLNFRATSATFDWYRNRVSPFAGVRRFRSLLARRSRDGGSQQRDELVGNPVFRMGREVQPDELDRQRVQQDEDRPGPGTKNDRRP